jgi:murein DD-endopeptidase MepM/ murein hydrolase activator NlpD
MFNVITAALMSVSLFFTGWYYSLSAKTLIDLPQAILPESESSCNDAEYLNMGSCVDDREVLTELLGPHEMEFLTIEEGQSLHSLLRVHKISEFEIARIALALKPYVRAKDLAPGDNYWFEIAKADGEAIVKALRIKKLDSNRVPILYDLARENKDVREPKFQVTKDQPVVVEKFAFIKLTVKGTLYQTFKQIPYGEELMQRFMNVFAWRLRLPQDVVQGDHIEILAKNKYVGDNFIGYGNIQSVYYRQKSQNHFAAYFVSEDKKHQGYFDEKGVSLEREFAVSPVFESTATSDQKWRLHPIRKMRIRHNGIDYRGTLGTDFLAIADGEVTEIGFDKEVGNMVRLLHKYGVHSEYFHADSLEPTLKVGSRVKRGQKLGAIGRTGRLCTGPHLHMGLYRMNGDKKKFIELSSLKNVLKEATSLGANYMAEYNQHVERLLALMEKPTPPMMASD